MLMKVERKKKKKEKKLLTEYKFVSNVVMLWAFRKSNYKELVLVCFLNTSINEFRRRSDSETTIYIYIYSIKVLIIKARVLGTTSTRYAHRPFERHGQSKIEYVYIYIYSYTPMNNIINGVCACEARGFVTRGHRSKFDKARWNCPKTYRTVLIIAIIINRCSYTINVPGRFRGENRTDRYVFLSRVPSVFFNFTAIPRSTNYWISRWRKRK